MTAEDLKSLVQEIVTQSRNLRDKHTSETNAPVNYAAVFAQTQDEYTTLVDAARHFGSVIKETPTGPLFQIDPLRTVAGDLRLLKIRAPDPTRTERGDADFTVSNYQLFKSVNLQRPGFKLIERGSMEMIELVDSSFDVRAYFSNPPLDKQLALI
ncbi:MAG: hypothetical protein HY567_00835 [Candidatus Kerfeldbacteria bacterium]|nr:hypothetical protein [Candidatus Kerfeldbacteria bacterium]